MGCGSSWCVRGTTGPVPDRAASLSSDHCGAYGQHVRQMRCDLTPRDSVVGAQKTDPSRAPT